MSERVSNLLLDDIKESLQNIAGFTAGMTLDMYVADLKTRHAVERNF